MRQRLSAKVVFLHVITKRAEAHAEQLRRLHLDAAGTCRACGTHTEFDGFPLACRGCGSLDVQLSQGEELLVDALTMQEVPSGRS